MIKGLIGGVLGVALALFLWHAWIDHAALHALIDLVNANAQRAQQQAQPEAPK